MSRCGFFLSLASFSSAAWITLSCGGGAEPRPLQSVTLSPASADAQNYPNGQVPFIATGHYNSAPTVVTPLDANWAAESEQVVKGIETFGPANGAVLVDSSGVAQCAAGASGTYGIIAWDLEDPQLKVACSSETFFGEPGCNAVQGTARLTCP